MNKQYLIVVGIVFLIQIVRYSVMAGGAFYYLWVRNKQKYQARKIQPQPFEKSHLKRELKNSILFSALSAVFFALPYFGPLAQYSTIYMNASEHSMLWFWVQIPVLILIHDTYFYWMHRAIHQPKLYWIHKEHHESRDPSPLASYSFHWIESVLEFGWFIPLMFMIPIHYNSMLVFGSISLLFNINGHLGVDLFPKSWATHPILKWLNTSPNHNSHHKYFKGNYGFYFMFWDRLMKTHRQQPSLRTQEQAA